MNNTSAQKGRKPVATPISKERDAELRAILRRKEEEVKELLAPEKEMRDIDNLANKIVAEVRALEAKGGDDGAENSEFTYLAAVETPPQFHCPSCGNRNQSNFMLDAKQGDTICLGADGQGCGVVVQDHKVHEGSMYRKFEGEADRSHHGPAPNRLYSTAHNMRTWISEGKDANRLRNLAEDVEMGLSNVGKEERKTRTAYKDQMKREAFDLVNHIAANCDLHETVVVRAKELFAGWRNVKEHVNQKHAVICACIVAAYRQVSMDELSRQFDLKKRREALAENGEGAEDPLYPFVCSDCKAGFNAVKALHAHRKEVHKGSRKDNAAPLPEVTGNHANWTLKEAREWLTRTVAKLGFPETYVQSICAVIEKNLNAQNAEQRSGRKRKRTIQKTAGQFLMLLSVSKLRELCGGGMKGAKDADKLHQEIALKRAERDRRDKIKKANYNAAQRNHQNVRKPWVAHVDAELKSEALREQEKESQAVSAAAAAAAAAAAPPAVAPAVAPTLAAAPGSAMPLVPTAVNAPATMSTTPMGSMGAADAGVVIGAMTTGAMMGTTAPQGPVVNGVTPGVPAYGAVAPSPAAGVSGAGAALGGVYTPVPPVVSAGVAGVAGAAGVPGYGTVAPSTSTNITSVEAGTVVVHSAAPTYSSVAPSPAAGVVGGGTVVDVVTPAPPSYGTAASSAASAGVPGAEIVVDPVASGASPYAAVASGNAAVAGNGAVVDPVALGTSTYGTATVPAVPPAGVPSAGMVNASAPMAPLYGSVAPSATAGVGGAGVGGVVDTGVPAASHYMPVAPAPSAGVPTLGVSVDAVTAGAPMYTAVAPSSSAGVTGTGVAVDVGSSGVPAYGAVASAPSGGVTEAPMSTGVSAPFFVDLTLPTEAFEVMSGTPAL